MQASGVKAKWRIGDTKRPIFKETSLAYEMPANVARATHL